MRFSHSLGIYSSGPARKIAAPLALLFLFGFVYFVDFATAVPTDVTADGRSDFLTAEVSPEGNLSFHGFDLNAGSTIDLGQLGTLGDHIAFGNWVTPGQPNIAVVSKENNELRWQILSNTESRAANFGTTSEVFLSGADLDNDGKIEALSTGVSGRKRYWKMAKSLFDGERVDREFNFGFANELPFYIHTPSGDAPATLAVGNRGTFIRVFNINSRKARRIRLSKAPEKITPLPIRFSSSISGIAYTVQSSTQTKIYYHQMDSKSPVLEGTVEGTGTVIVGDFLPDEGEEIAIHSGSKLLVHSRIENKTVEFTVPAGIAIDEININSFEGSASPTPTPTPPTTTPVPGGAPPAEGLSAVCESYSAIAPGEMLIKSEPSNHIGSHDPRTSGYTVVCARECPAILGYAQFFFSNGEFAGAVARYGTFSGNGRPRMYGAVGKAPQHNAREIAARAATIGNGKLYLQISAVTSGSGTICKEFNPTGRNGSL